MSRTQTMVQLTDALVADLDREATQLGVSRSEVIRRAVEQYLDEQGEAGRIQRYVDGYRRTPPAAPDGWGEPEREADVHGHELAQRLDAEEEEAGLSW